MRSVLISLEVTYESIAENNFHNSYSKNVAYDTYKEVKDTVSSLRYGFERYFPSIFESSYESHTSSIYKSSNSFEDKIYIAIGVIFVIAIFVGIILLFAFF